MVVMVSKRKGKPPLILPTELAVVEQQLRNASRFKFRLRWELMHSGDRRPFRSKITSWTAGSMDELLAAIERVSIELARCAGIERLDTTHRKCAICGRLLAVGTVHTTDQCAANRANASARYKLIGLANAGRQTKVYRYTGDGRTRLYRYEERKLKHCSCQCGARAAQRARIKYWVRHDVVCPCCDQGLCAYARHRIKENANEQLDAPAKPRQDAGQI